MMKENPNMTLEQYCGYYADVIYVRSRCSGKWKSEKFSDLPEEEKQKFLADWRTGGEDFRPARILEAF